jgi:hypothetical protein
LAVNRGTAETLNRNPRNLRQGVDYAFAALIGAGTVINPIIKIVTTVVILAAVGIFIVRPVLDTTEKAIDEVGSQIEGASRASEQAVRDSQISSARSRADSYADSLQATWPAAAREVRECVREAGDKLGPMNRCADFGQRLTHTVQSDRNFALSYANSLAAQGRGDDAERVRDCVKDAGFQAAAMNRCRRLADDLLFG